LASSDAIEGLVSVVMPSFNHAAFVAEAMRSVFDQSYRDVEFLVLDDCSTDQTFAVIRDVADVKQFRRRFRRLEISRNQQNQGAHHSLNLGLAAARGEFVTFINSDDCYEPERLQLLTSRSHQADEPFLAFSALRLIDALGRRVRRHELKDVLELGPNRLRAALPSLSFAFLRYQLAGSTGNIFLNRTLATEIGGFCALKYCHDWEFMLRAITVVEPCYVPETAYRYRIHGANAFSNLQHLATDDTEASLGSYYRRIASRRVSNPMAPTPANWPYVFDMIARQFGVYDAWLREAECSPRYASRLSEISEEVSGSEHAN
jgi:glycosyltransferase involved in cell wall biosynthesis